MKKRIEKKIIKILDKIEKNERARTLFCISFFSVIFWGGLFLGCWLSSFIK